LIISSYALLSDRAWVLHGSPLREAPDLDRIGPGYALRAQELPDSQEFAAARGRAAVLFGVHVPETLFARTVNRLAEDVRGKLAVFEGPLNGVRRSLDKHAEALGLVGGDARRTAVRQAAVLLARLAAARDATALVRELVAGAAVPDETLAATVTSAAGLLAALDDVEWTLLDAVQRFTGRGDGIGDRAERLLEDLAMAAAADELAQPLAPVLAGLRRQAVTIVNDAAERAAVSPHTSPPASKPVSHKADPRTTDQPPTHGDAVHPASGASSRFMASAVESELGRVQSRLRDYARRNPDAEIEVTWRVVEEGRSG
jgi:hypothetical protein